MKLVYLYWNQPLKCLYWWKYNFFGRSIKLALRLTYWHQCLIDFTECLTCQFWMSKPSPKVLFTMRNELPCGETMLAWFKWSHQYSGFSPGDKSEQQRRLTGHSSTSRRWQWINFITWMLVVVFTNSKAALKTVNGWFSRMKCYFFLPPFGAFSSPWMYLRGIW